jgi:hypothetical protein
MRLRLLLTNGNPLKSRWVRQPTTKVALVSLKEMAVIGEAHSA